MNMSCYSARRSVNALRFGQSVQRSDLLYRESGMSSRAAMGRRLTGLTRRGSRYPRNGSKGFQVADSGTSNQPAALSEATATATATATAHVGLLSHPAHLISFGFGCGLFPYAPGTIATLWAWVIFLMVDPFMTDFSWALCIGGGCVLGA